MKKGVSCTLIVFFILLLCSAAFADGWEAPAGTTVFEPNCVMNLEFGTLTVVDVGYAKKVELCYTTVGTETVSKNGETEEIKLGNESYATAENGSAFFVVKGILTNTSNTIQNTKNMCASLQVNEGKLITMDVYPAVDLLELASMTLSPGAVVDLAPNESIDVDFACTISSELYAQKTVAFFTLAGSTLGIQTAEMKSYISIGFGEKDGELTDNIISLVSDQGNSRQEGSGATEKTASSIAIEGVSFEQRSSETYNMRVCARNTGFPVLDNRQLINVVVYFRLLDASGNGIPANISFVESWDEFPNLPVGQSCWTTSIHTIDKAAVDAAKLIEFTSCEFRYSQNELGEWKQIKEKFSEPVSFRIADILPVGVDPFILENVSIEFIDSLPSYITKQTPWQAGLSEGFDYVLNNSETYAAIRFSITNMTKQDIILNDLSGDCIIELNFDDGFIYSTNGTKPSFIKSGNNYAVMNRPSQTHSQRIGDEITLSPLVTYDVELFIRCAKAVATQTDKSLVVSIRTSQPGYNQVDAVLR